MDKIVYEKYRLAGEIAAEARDLGVRLIKPGVSVLEVAEKIEEYIKSRGAEPSFPVNISINEVAAHFTPRSNYKEVFRRGDVVKLDVGTHVDGYIADTAITVEVSDNKYTGMIKTVEEALEKAIEIIKPGVHVSEIGRVIEETVVSQGYKPIDNLTGHSLSRYILHAGLSIPNVASMRIVGKLKKGDVVAIEPFVTNGRGHVISGDGSNIYIIKQSLRLIREKQTRIFLQKLRTRFKTLPFAHRWCTRLSGYSEATLNRLNYLGFISQYPQLVEENKGIVTQKEHTLILTENSCEVIT